MLELQAHPSCSKVESKVHVSFQLAPKEVIVDFEVITPNIVCEEKFSESTWDNWGLWETDVVEVFIQRKNPLNHYLELQVSPLNQKFALLVKKPRADYTKLVKLKTQATAKCTENGFKAQFIIDVDDIPGNGDELLANFHACLGPSDKREYFAYKNNTEDNPDFHQTKNFQSIGVLS